MDFQRAAGRCEAAGRFPQLASEFLFGSVQMRVGKERRQIPLSILKCICEAGNCGKPRLYSEKHMK